MQYAIEFSKMQCLLTGNRFSGVNIHKTRYDFTPEPSKKVKGLSLTLALSVDVDYLEVNDDKVKYLQYATWEIEDAVFRENNVLAILKDGIIKIQSELIRRYETCQLFKFLELKDGPDKLADPQLTERLIRIISDYKNGKR